MANSYTTYIGWVAKTNQDWLKFASDNTEGDNAGFVTLSKNRRILTVSDDGGAKVENFTILYDAEPNFSVNERSATVTLTQNYNSTSGAIKTVEITQTGSKITAATFTVKDGNIIRSEKGITYNILYTIGVPRPDAPILDDHIQPSDGALDEPVPADHIQPSDGALDEPVPADHIQPSDDDLLTAYNEVNGHSLDNIDSLDDASAIYDDTIINNEAEGIEAIDPSVLPSDDTSEQNTSPWIEAGSAVLPSDDTSGQHSMDTHPSDEQLQPIWVTGHPSIDDEVIWADPGNAEVDDQIVNPNHGISENDDTDVYMNRKYNFDSGNVITPDAGAVRTKLTCEVKFIVEVKFHYSASTMTNKGLYCYCGEREYVSKDRSPQPIWYKAVYDERTSKYYKDDKLSYNNDDEYAILHAINSSTSEVDENINMSAATSQTVSSIISNCSWHKDSDQSYVTLTTSATYGYYEYTYNDNISDQTQDLADRPITIIRKRNSLLSSWSSLKLIQPRNSFISGYDATAWIGNGDPSTPLYVNACSGTTTEYYKVTRTLVYPTGGKTISVSSGTTFVYEMNLSVNQKTYAQQNVHVSSVLGLTNLDILTTNNIVQAGIPENDIEMTSSGYEYDITSIIYNGTSYDVGKCIPYASGSLTVNADVTGNYRYRVSTCNYDIIFSRSSLTPATVTQDVSENTDTSSRDIDVTINGTAVINVIDGLVETKDFSIRGRICQEGRNRIFKLESNPENAEFNVGHLPLIDSNWDTRDCELTITHEE